MAEEKSVKELEQETRNKLEKYETLLKENPTLNQVYKKDGNATIMAAVGVLFAIVSIFIGIFPLGLVIAVVLGVIAYKRNKYFELSFEEMASDELKKARKDYEDCKKRQEEAEKAEKEKRSAELQAKIQQAKEQADQALVQKANTLSAYDEVDDDDDEPSEEEQERLFQALFNGLYHEEIECVSYHAIHTSDLSERIGKNTLIAYTYIGKVILLGGEIRKIDYDKRRNMPYVLIGSGEYFPANVRDEYACYFSDPKQIDIIKNLRVGDTIMACGIFSENKYELPCHYLLLQSYALDKWLQ